MKSNTLDSKTFLLKKIIILVESLQDINPVERALVNKATANRTPINATIELTPTCNFRCDMCYIRMEKSQAEKEEDYGA